MIKLYGRNAHFFLLILAVLGYPCCVGFSLGVGSGGYSLGALRGLLMWWLLRGSRTPGLQELQLPASGAPVQ